MALSKRNLPRPLSEGSRGVKYIIPLNFSSPANLFTGAKRAAVERPIQTPLASTKKQSPIKGKYALGPDTASGETQELDLDGGDL